MQVLSRATLDRKVQQQPGKGRTTDASGWTVGQPEGCAPCAPRLVTDDLHMLHEGALRGGGVVLLPTVAVAGDLEAGRLIDLLPDWRPTKWIVHAVFPSRRGLLPSGSYNSALLRAAQGHDARGRRTGRGLDPGHPPL